MGLPNTNESNVTFITFKGVNIRKNCENSMKLSEVFERIGSVLSSFEIVLINMKFSENVSS